MVNLRCPVCAGALEKRAGAYLCPKNHSFDIAKSGYVNLLLNSSQGHHGDDKLMVRARRDFLDKGYYDRFIAAVADAAAEFTPQEATQSTSSGERFDAYWSAVFEMSTPMSAPLFPARSIARSTARE